MDKKTLSFRLTDAQRRFADKAAKVNRLSNTTIYISALRFLLQKVEKEQLITPYREEDDERYFDTKLSRGRKAATRKPKAYSYPEEEDFGLQAAEDQAEEPWHES